MKLKINNFQAIKDAELEFNGFSVIIGKSNTGKSTIRRAIETALFNSWNAHYLRHDTKEANIDLSYNDLNIHARKSKTINEFQINGKSYLKMGKEKPDLPNFRQELNITTQFEPLFMVAYSNTENTRIFNNIFGVSKLEEAQSMCANDLRATKIEFNKLSSQLEPLKNEKRDIDAQIKQLQDAISRYDKLISQATLIENYLKIDLRAIQATIKQLDDDLHSLDEKMAKIGLYELLNGYLKVLSSIKTLSNKIIAIPDFTKFRGVFHLIDYLGILKQLRRIDLTTIDNKLAKVNKDLKSLVCPTCKRVYS